MVAHALQWHVIAMSLTLLLVGGCESWDFLQNEGIKTKSSDSRIIMNLTSSDFENNTKIDKKNTVEGQNISPHLTWSDMPPDTKSLALICEDPDAPSPRRPAAEPWVHWIIFNIPPDQSELPPAIERKLKADEVPGALQGVNSWPNDNVGYRGPAPPPGSGKHHYFFKLYALDIMLDLNAGATKQQLLKAMTGHILAEDELVGFFER